MRFAGSSRALAELFGEGSAIGKGRRASVVEGPNGSVIKGMAAPAPGGDIMEDVEQWEALAQASQEASFQQAAAELGIAPRVRNVETGSLAPDGVTPTAAFIEMDDLRPNYSPADFAPTESGLNQLLGTYKQAAHLALRGIELGDRHKGNVMVNNLTGRTQQIDFGAARALPDTRQQASAVAGQVAAGLRAVGLDDVGDILIETVFGLNKQGKSDQALDVAKQGMSRLMKIRRPSDVQFADPSQLSYTSFEQALRALHQPPGAAA